MALLQNLVSAVSRRYPDGNPARVMSTGWGGEPGYIIDPPPVRGLGFTVNDDSALTIAAVYRAVQIVASTIASLPLHVYETQDDGSDLRVQYGEDAYLWKRPNEEVPDVVFWETVLGHEVLNGNAYIYVQKDKRGNPAQLWPISPRRVWIGRDENGVKFYAVDGELAMKDFLYGGEIVHIPGFGHDGLVGISPIKSFALTFGLAKAAEEYGARLFSQGTTLGGVLQTDQKLTKEQANELSARWTQFHQGMENVHRTAIMDNGLKWQATSMNPEDAQMMLSRAFSVEEVARIFGIPLHLLGANDKQTSWGSGIEVNNRFFLQTGLLPHMRRFEATVRDELMFGLRTVRWNVEGLLRGTSRERASFYNMMRNMGVFTVNDVLRLEHMPTIGDEGDTRTVPLNMGELGAPEPDLALPPG